MQNTILINKLQAVIDNHNPNFNASEAVQNIIKELKNEVLNSTFKGSKKKAQSMFKGFIKNKQPILSYSKLFDGKYWATDSYIAIETNDPLITVVPENLEREYPNIRECCKLKTFEKFNFDKNIFNQAIANYKLNKDSRSKIYEDESGIGAVANKYLTFVYNFFGGADDIEIGRNDYRMFKFTKNGDSIYVAGIRNYTPEQ